MRWKAIFGMNGQIRTRPDMPDINFIISMGVILAISVLNAFVYFTDYLDRETYALSAYLFFHWKEYYRVFSYMLLHSGTEHLLMNTVSLIGIGQYICRYRNGLYIMLVYFAGGVGAGLVSICYAAYVTGETGVQTVGASGAVFALFGATLTQMYLSGKRRLLHLMLAAALALAASAGFKVDSAAHAGGFICGVLISMVLYITGGKKR